MNLSAVDLNLFLVFHAVYEEGSTTRAAARLNVTQSAVSNALARLRGVVGDPLFVRSGRGLVPTPAAEELRPAVAEALGQLQGALGARFDPAETRRTFTLACADHHQAADVPRVVRAFAAAFPLACLRVVSVDYLLATDGLATGRVDAAIAPAGTDGAGLYYEPLFDEAATLLVRRDHPGFGATATIAELEAAGHIDVHLALGAPGDVNRQTGGALDAHGLTRRVVLVVPSFTAAAAAAAETELVAWVPEHAARLFTAVLPLRRVELPFPPLVVGCGLAWHERTRADPGARAFRALVIAALAESAR